MKLSLIKGYLQPERKQQRKGNLENPNRMQIKRTKSLVTERNQIQMQKRTKAQVNHLLQENHKR
jgi:hypothetical protein